jgi:hypothetical protein
VEYLEATLPDEDGDAKKPLDAYEDLKRRYNMDDAGAGAGGGASSSSGGARAGAGAGAGSGGGGGAKAAEPAAAKKKTADEEVDEMLAALKKKLGKS